MKRLRFPLLTLLLNLSAAVCAPSLRAQDLPTEHYTSADGLVQDAVNRVVYDPGGFLWIGGSTAITRFDGQQFISYGHAEGLDLSTGVNDLRLDAHGDLWAATNGAGLIKLNRATTDPAGRFTRLTVGADRASNRVNKLLILGEQLWAGTDAGLFLRDLAGAFKRVSLSSVEGTDESANQIVSLAATSSTVWVGASSRVYQCDRASARCISGPPGLARALLLDESGRLWIGRSNGIERWRLDPGGSVVGKPELLGAGLLIRSMSLASDGVLVATGDRRVISIDGDTSRVLVASIDTLQVNDIVEDPSHNVWVGTTSGLVGVRRQGVTLFTARRWLRPPHLRSLRRDSRGHPYVLGQDNRVDRIEGDRITAVRLVLPEGVSHSSWSQSAIHIDAAGDVWLGTGSGIYRYSSPPFSAEPVPLTPDAVFTIADGLAGQHVSELFEDSRGDIWIANVPAGGETLTVWRRRSSRFERLGAASGLPPANQLNGFVEDARGAVWARLREGGLVRIRDGVATVFAADQGFPQLAFALYVDRRGILWVSTGDSLMQITDTSADAIEPRTVLSGLNAAILSMAEDRSGALFVGTYEGLFKFDPDRRTLRRISTFEGFPRGSVDALVADPEGALLAMAGRTLARVAIATRSPDGATPPRCVLSSVRTGGQLLPLPEAGLEQIATPDLHPSKNQIEIELAGLSSRLGEPLAYEYRLVGVTDAWTRPPERRVSFAGLAPGRYRFEARATGADGASVSRPAVVSFRVLPPWYQRAWFVSLVVAVLLLATYAGHRTRLSHAVRTERLRSRIATDLHDDIGSSLSQIAILAEVARRRAVSLDRAVAEPLSSIAATSRDLVDAMSDIVWAVNPRTDSLSDLTHRMHRFAEETLGGADIALRFSAPPSEIDLKLGADLRRELYLVLKESVNNIARHSGASDAVVELSLARSHLRLEISDNGRGFDPLVRGDGNGVASMRKRAAAFGGVFRIDSAAGRGTRVSLGTDLRRHHY